MIHNVAHSITLLADGCDNFRKYLIEDTRPNLKKIKDDVSRSLMLVTALTPVIGYDKASKIAHHAMEHDLTLKQAALELKFVDEATFDRVVDPRKMVKPYVAEEFGRRAHDPEKCAVAFPRHRGQTITTGDDAMARIVADYMAETLKQVGVKRIYGVVGDTLNGFTDALRRIGGIDWMHMRHEEAGAFAGGGAAHCAGELSVSARACAL